MSLELPKDKQLAEKVIDGRQEEAKLAAQHAELRIRRGALGWLFGTGRQSATNIAGLCIIALLLAGVVVSFRGTGDSAFSVKDFWSVIAPIIFGALGYIFGSTPGTRDRSQAPEEQ